MKTLRIPGKPIGYYTQGARPNWSRLTQYVDYKRHVQVCAHEQGIELPLFADKDNQLVINARAWFTSGVHHDPENIRKGIVDALFYNAKGKKTSDKHVGGWHDPPNYIMKGGEAFRFVVPDPELAAASSVKKYIAEVESKVRRAMQEYVEVEIYTREEWDDLMREEWNAKREG